MLHKPTALSTRLLLASALVLPVFLGISAYMLDLAFQRSLLAAEKEKLNSHVYVLLAAAELIGDQLWLPDELTEPRFSQLNSGLYGFVYNKLGVKVWHSPSARLLGGFAEQKIAQFKPGQSLFIPVTSENKNYYSFQYDVSWESDAGKQYPYRFNVMHSEIELQAELAAYRGQLWWLLGSLALLLLVTQVWIMRWGLLPLRALAENVKAVEQGKASRLEGSYPKEIQPVTENLNQLLKSEGDQRERYRNTLADLAHSLKTPLAVLRGNLQGLDKDRSEQLDEQVSRMDDIISHQLRRAVGGSKAQSGRRIEVVLVIDRIVAALKKVYLDKGIELNVEAECKAHFFGDEADLMELLGNLIDNAFKYGNHHVKVSVKADDTALHILIADDGIGVDDMLRQQILQRGARADTAQPGQGIGLAVAIDIISGYQGSLEVFNSSLGGAEFRLYLPY